MKNDKEKRTEDKGNLRNYSQVLSFERLSDRDVEETSKINAGGNMDKE